MSWNLSKAKGPEWPKDDNGDTIPPVYLMDISGGPLDTELTLNLLEAYGIPHVCQYPLDGLFGKLIVGHPPYGMEVYVPETMLEDAQNILNADTFEEMENEAPAAGDDA